MARRGQAVSNRRRTKNHETDPGLEPDEIDHVMNKRNKILLNKDEDPNQDSDDMDEEEVMDLGLDDSEEEEDQQSDASSISSDYSDAKDEEEDDQWGKNKRVYYSADRITEGDGEEEDSELWAQEAQRLRQQQLTAMRTADYAGGDDPNETSFAMLLDRRAKDGTKTMSSATAAAVPTEVSQSLLASMNRALDMTNLPGSQHVEIVTKDLSSLSKDAQLRLLLNDAPEFLQLLTDFREKLSEVRNHLTPLMQKATTARTSKGISLLEIKYHLLLNYCTNILFYLLRKSEGKSVRDHPVIEHLVRLRVILEKLRPLEAKLSYQIDKLVRTAMTTEIKPKFNPMTNEMTDQDPLQFKPNPERLIPRDEKNRKDIANPEDSEEESPSTNDTYRISKRMPVAYDGDSSARGVAKQQRYEEHRQARSMKSRLLKDLQSEFSLQPEEFSEQADTERLDAQQEKADARLEAIRQYEEEHFVRLPLSKKEKQRLKQRQAGSGASLENELDTLNEFTDLFMTKEEQPMGKKRLNDKLAGNDLDDKAPSKSHKQQRTSQALEDALEGLSSRDEQRNRQRSSIKGDDDIPYRTYRDNLVGRLRTEDVEENFGSGRPGTKREEVSVLSKDDDNDDNLAEDDYYEKVRASKRVKAEKREAEHHRPDISVDDKENLEGKKRAVNYQIMKNRGLTVNHKKENRNPRVKHREKYGKALKRLGTSRPSSKTFAGESGVYGGESTGIKSSISKSVRFN